MRNFIKKILLHLFILTVSIVGFFTIANGQLSFLPAPQSTEKIDFFVDWSAQTFTPANYQGKALPTFRSQINLSATPINVNGQKINVTDYSFNWIIDNSETAMSRSDLSQFRVGKGSGSEHEIYLRIFNKNKNLVGEYFFVIPISKPDVIIYQKNNNKTAENINGQIFVNSGSELNLIAKPFFFNNIDNETDLAYTWKLNGKGIKRSTIDPNSITIAFPPEISSGTRYTIKLEVENPQDPYQFSEKSYIITIR